uniref:SCP domain-containing protein n=1 Tax=Ditylenchus dipsaci TaxID=166011 RepID=A0A915DC76_9BILA
MYFDIIDIFGNSLASDRITISRKRGLGVYNYNITSDTSSNKVESATNRFWVKARQATDIFSFDVELYNDAWLWISVAENHTKEPITYFQKLSQMVTDSGKGQKMWFFILVVNSYFITDVSTLTAAQQSIALESHNNYRSQLAKGQSLDNNNFTMPQGKNIYQLIYNQTLEDSAQLWANNCSWKHSGAGENMFASSANLSLETALSDASNSWWAELAQYGMNHELNLTRLSSTKQLVIGLKWLGAELLYLDAVATIVVCHYKEYGNLINSKVYEAGSPCAVNADCTTFPNSVCNVTAGLCLTTA